MQKGTITRRGDSWFLTSRDTVLKDGQLIRKQRMVKLANHSNRYLKESDLSDLANDILQNVQAAVKCPQSANGFNDYFQTTYLPAIRRTKAASTARAYESYFKAYIKPRLAGQSLRDVDIRAVATLLESAASMHKLNCDTVKKIRSIISAVYTFAMTHGDIHLRSQHDNPASRASIGESASKPKETAWPSQEEFP
jgi:hypothetical protein